MEEQAIVLAETNRVVAGILASDAMLKKAALELVEAFYVSAVKMADVTLWG